MENPKIENFGKSKAQLDPSEFPERFAHSRDTLTQSLTELEELGNAELRKEELQTEKDLEGKPIYSQEKAENVKKRAVINKFRTRERLCLNYFWSLSNEKRHAYSEKYGYHLFLKALDVERPKVTTATVIEDFIRETIKAQMFEEQLSKFGPAVGFVKTHWVGVIREDYLRMLDQPEEFDPWLKKISKAMKAASEQLIKKGKQKILIDYTPEQLKELLAILINN